MLCNQEIRADEQEDDQGNVRLELHRASAVRFVLVFHEEFCLYRSERARQGGSTPPAFYSNSGAGKTGGEVHVHPYDSIDLCKPASHASNLIV